MNLFALFADALDYPTADLPRIVDQCLEQIAADAAAPLETFRDYVRSNPIEKVQERYTSTFDLGADCCLYAGHHLIGDDPRRGIFLARLNGHYREHRFSAGTEMPDHLSVMLRFLATNGSDAASQELIAECIVPAAQKLTLKLDKKNDPFAGVTRALSRALENR